MKKSPAKFRNTHKKKALLLTECPDPDNKILKKIQAHLLCIYICNRKKNGLDKILLLLLVENLKVKIGSQV